MFWGSSARSNVPRDLVNDSLFMDLVSIYLRCFYKGMLCLLSFAIALSSSSLCRFGERKNWVLSRFWRKRSS